MKALIKHWVLQYLILFYFTLFVQACLSQYLESAWYIPGQSHRFPNFICFSIGPLILLIFLISDFQKAAAFLHEFMLKLQDDSECAELRDSLNLALLHMQKYYRVLQHRNHEKNIATSLSLTARGLSPMTPFVDAPDKFQYKWINLDSFRLKASMGMDDSLNIIQLPPVIQAAKNGSVEDITHLINDGIYFCFLNPLYTEQTLPHYILE